MTDPMRQTTAREWPAFSLVKCLLLIALLVVSVSSFGARDGLQAIERDAPVFSLESIGSGQWQAERLNGKPWVINFWATWCPPCIEELPSMNAAWDVLEDKGVGMLAINAGEGEQTVRPFLDRVAIDFPVLLGDADTLPNWTVRALPTTLVINADGKVVYEAIGPREWDDEALLQHVIDLL